MKVRFSTWVRGSSIKVIKVDGTPVGTVGRKGDIRRFGYLPLLEVEPGTEDDWFVMIGDDTETFKDSAEARGYIDRKCKEL